MPLYFKSPLSFLSMASGTILALGLASASMAQDAPAPAEAPIAPPTLETAEVGQVYLAEKSDPWELRCTKIETGQGPCQIFQLLRDDAGGDVAEFNIFALPEGTGVAAGAVIAVPLETLLEPGLILQIDDNEARGYPFSFCNSYGCIARPGFTEEELGWMKAGNQAVLTIVPAMAPDTKVALTLSLKGFTAMLEKTKQGE